MTTPIIHPINEKKPDASRAAWLNKMQTMLELYARYGMYQNESQLQEALRLRDEILTALPPEVTPEQGKPLSKCCQAPLKVSSAREGTQFYVCTKCGNPSDAIGDGPASGPSPAALAAAKEIVESIYHVEELKKDGTYEKEIAAIAAIIDRNFPREEDGALLDWMDKHWHDWQKYLTTDSDGWAYRLGKDAWQEANTFRRAVAGARRAALQDSREGK